MTAPICLVFPHQLFEQHPAFAEVQTFWLIEDDLFFMRLPFHRKKLAYHRASMSYYAEKLRSKGFEVRYIERLMLLGNFFFLSEIHPDEVYRFFMTHFMDAYDWVMVPNVYGMSQYADGGLMTTKPYFSGSNYLKKQGFKIDTEGAVLFDALFWHFVDKHQERLRKNLRTVQMVANWNRMLPQKKAAHLERAAFYFENGA